MYVKTQDSTASSQSVATAVKTQKGLSKQQSVQQRFQMFTVFLLIVLELKGASWEKAIIFSHTVLRNIK